MTFPVVESRFPVGSSASNNFGPPINYMSSPQFGQSTQMLGASLGTGGQNGGLNPLYQIG